MGTSDGTDEAAPTGQRPGRSAGGHVRPPRQSRSAATFDCFLAATYELLLDQPPTAVRVADIVDRAERPNGSFYARFSGKWAAIDAVLDQVMDRREELAAHYLRTAVDLPLPTLVERYVTFVQSSYGSSLVPTSALLLRSAQRPDLFLPRRARWFALAREWARVVAGRGITHPRPERAAVTAFFLVQAIVSWEHLYGPFAGDRPLGTDLLVDLVLLVLGEEPVGDLDHHDPVPTVPAVAGERRLDSPPPGGRSREAYDAFLEALESLLGEVDFDDIAVSDIARQAYRSNGSFYGLFASKEDCLVALLEHRLPFSGETPFTAGALGQSLRRLPLSHTVANGVDIAVRRAMTASPLQTTFCRQAVTDPGVRRLFRQQRADMAEHFRRLVLGHPDQPRHPVPGLVYLAAVSLLDSFVLIGRDAVTPLWRPQSLVEELAEVGLRLLGLPVPHGPAVAPGGAISA